MPTDWVQCPRIGCNAHGSGVPGSQTGTIAEPGIPQYERSGLNTPTQTPGLGMPIKRRRHEGRYTRCVALHPIRTGAMPTDRVQCPRIGCNAHGSAVPGSQTGTIAEPGIPQYERSGLNTPHITRDLVGQSSGDVTRGATPVVWRYTRYVVLHPIRTGAMPTDRVYRAGLVWFCGPGVVRVVGCYWWCCAHWRAYWLGESQPTALWGCSSL